MKEERSLLPVEMNSAGGFCCSPSTACQIGFILRIETLRCPAPKQNPRLPTVRYANRWVLRYQEYQGKNMKSQLVDYVFIDELQLNKYSEQIPLKLSKERKNSWKFSLSLTGPIVETGQEVTNRASNNHEKIQSLLEFLRKNELVAEKRPVKYSEFENSKPFVFETVVASKIIIPESKLKSVNGLKGFSIWVAEPEIETLKALVPKKLNACTKSKKIKPES